MREIAQYHGGRRGSRLAGLLAVALGLAPGCDDAPKREPIPNPPSPAVQSEDGGPEAKPLDDDAAAEAYLEIKEKFAADPAVAQGAQWPELNKRLEEIANGAGAKPMRANAALLLGAMEDARGDAAKSAGYYEHAATLIPDDAGPFMALALAYARAKNFTEAVKAQEDAARLDPDNLENWLALGELRMRAGDEDGSVQAYLAYEKRRKGLIDGLTLHDDEGHYVVEPDERVACAELLAAAADQGTAVALIYSLRTDPEATVRAAVARVMGTHRLESYGPVLKTQSTEEADAAAKEAVAWALAEIERSPVKMDDTERPRLPDDDPRAAQGEVPRAESAPVAPTKETTLAPEGGVELPPVVEGKAGEGKGEGEGGEGKAAAAPTKGAPDEGASKGSPGSTPPSG